MQHVEPKTDTNILLRETYTLLFVIQLYTVFSNRTVCFAERKSHMLLVFPQMRRIVSHVVPSSLVNFSQISRISYLYYLTMTSIPINFKFIYFMFVSWVIRFKTDDKDKLNFFRRPITPKLSLCMSTPKLTLNMYIMNGGRGMIMTYCVVHI